jgi:Zn-dependent protease with chaperone function
VKATELIENGTTPCLFGGFILAGIGFLLGILVTYGILLIAAIIAPIVDYFNRKKLMAMLKGSAVEIGPDQLPEIHRCATFFARRLGMDSTPDLFLVEGNVLNASASKIAGRKVIILVDDVVDACLRTGNPRALAFIIGHEMAHHALGHTGLFRSWLSRAYKKLSRLDEFSCDAVAARLMDDDETSALALVTMLTGPHLIPYLNFENLKQQARDLAANKYAVKAERTLTHPLLLRRLERMLN